MLPFSKLLCENQQLANITTKLTGCDATLLFVIAYYFTDSKIGAQTVVLCSLNN